MDPISDLNFEALCRHRVVKSTLIRVIKYVSDEIESRSTPFRKDHLRQLEEAMSSISAALEKVLSADDTRRLQQAAYNVEVLLDKASTFRLEWSKRTVDANGKEDHDKLLDYFTSAPEGVIADLSSFIQSSIKASNREVPPTFFIKSKTRAGVKESSSYDQQQLVGLEETIFGREEEKKHLIGLILAPPTTRQHPIVIEVTGDGGIGKTTLVKQVCNDSRVSSSFDVVLWASCASGLTFNFFETDVPEAASSWFAHQEPCTESFSRRLTKFLHGWKCLLVLDDINASYWKINKALEILKAGSTGSTIILITWQSIEIERFRKSFKLDVLPEEECWSLFKRYAAFDEDSEQAASLKDIGRSIVSKCCGNPLAVKTMAISLRNKAYKHYWEHIVQSTSWRGINSAWPGLYFTVAQLPYEVIECYTTFCIVARGNSASRDQVIYFWMALGLLQSTQKNEDLIDVGNRFCNELLSMNLLKLCQSDYLSPVCYSAQLLMENVRGYLCSYVRHLKSAGYGNGNSSEILRMSSQNAEKVRTLIFRDNKENVSKLLMKGNISKLTHLRVLFVEHSEIEKLPKTIGDLKFLRYLSLAGNRGLQKLPDSICKLLNLQTLDLSDCVQLEVLPSNMNQLVSLRHLLLSMKLTMIPKNALSWPPLHHLKICHCPNLESLEVGMPNLAALRALGIHDCPSIASLPDHLNRLTNLKELIIENCPNLYALPDCTPALRNLRVLKIHRCPKLDERYEIATRSGWHLKSNIPPLYVDGEVDTKKAMEEQPGDQNYSPSECQTDPSLAEIRPASATSPTEISSFPEKEDYSVQSPSEHDLAEHPQQAPIEHSHQRAVIRGSNQRPLNVTRKSFQAEPFRVQSIDDASLVNRGVYYNEQQPGKQLLDIEKEVEGKRILFLFGEGYEFEKEMLIQLWMAMGLFTDEPMEVVGANFFEKLVSEGYILCSFDNSLYKMNTEKLNSESDMIKERQNYVILNNRSQNDAASTGTLHVSVVCDEIDESMFRALGRFNRLRVLLFLRNYGSRLQEVPRDIFLCYESLVALDLSGAHIKELPSSAEKMIHLRFLDLSWTFIELLHEIVHFKMLQTLKLKGCSCLHRLPKELKVLIELRHLDLDVLGQLASFPEGIGALVNLRTLSTFPVGKEEGLKINELKFLDNLTGEFCIAKLENVQSAEDAKEASLATKRSIKKLELRWSDHQFQESKNEDELILENLCPYSDLEEIQILCYPGTSLPGWITDVSFHKLVSITLFRCVHISMLPLLGKLPKLASLELTSLNNVKYVNFKGEVGEIAFPKLQKLEVDEMLTLESWAEAQEGDYPCLINVSIKDCPKLPELPSLPYLPSIKNLEVSGCTQLAFVSEKELSPSLQQLIVDDCPLITERCSEQGGQDWHKIHHVLTIWIDQEAIKANEDLIEEDIDQEAIKANEVLIKEDSDDDKIQFLFYVQICCILLIFWFLSHILRLCRVL